ncbi:MAG: nuclear transport factor 2 family protein [Candidatus Marinimicrobia bacterium]|jgi:ketosteroid isomerase-like protein|nr:nuclear transport factor 2 family protein [Candidatus Neomarinimicrobiota bacterium]MBT3575623.1 nuclear transport factor 2 family protein [Candidatus Neomarinimicrobiota bacterium]MBT4035332.1 nuclear transport factor 2 family protein [Candidatus Neomarinimicrobiota bacterium]MBT4360784.1 nuclear transport factor 2 family protein [Candidatus Neomarinimicrobiota bacterium]MBT4419800.1 nuclear transport factor 2 family protein [Candidatus Neomarinimicrobiota bacterium]
MVNHIESVRYNEVVLAENALAEAHINLDLDVIDNLLHSDYTIIQPGGKVETKTDVLESYRSDQRFWSIAKTDQLDIHFYGDTAVVVGRWKAKGKNGEDHFNYSSRFLSIWINEDNEWKNVAFQSTDIDD